jgi:hypothetical protein
VADDPHPLNTQVSSIFCRDSALLIFHPEVMQISPHLGTIVLELHSRTVPNRQSFSKGGGLCFNRTS